MIPIHVARIYSKRYLFLKEEESSLFCWHFATASFEWDEATSCFGNSLSQAISNATRHWKEEGFALIHCGFLYTLPERDEVGANAFFSQMANSYSSPNGRYFEPQLGHLCYVDFASQEALQIWRALRR